MTKTQKTIHVLTARRFIDIALAIGNPSDALSSIRMESWPNFKEVSALAEDMAMELDPENKQDTRVHFALLGIAEWAAKQD